jgi:hypothetical protein
MHAFTVIARFPIPEPRDYMLFRILEVLGVCSVRILALLEFIAVGLHHLHRQISLLLDRYKVRHPEIAPVALEVAGSLVVYAGLLSLRIGGRLSFQCLFILLFPMKIALTREIPE